MADKVVVNCADKTMKRVRYTKKELAQQKKDRDAGRKQAELDAKHISEIDQLKARVAALEKR